MIDPSKNAKETYAQTMNLETNLSELAVSFFEGKKSLELMPYIYSDDPKGKYPVKGSENWVNLIDYESYYLYRQEIDLIEKYAQNIVKIIDKFTTGKPNIVDYGPGNGLKKMLPILNEFSKTSKDINSYIPVDLSKSFLDEAAAMAKGISPKITIKGVQSDLYSCGPYIKQYDNTATFFFGSTLGNTPEKFGSRKWPNTISKLKKLKNTLKKDAPLFIGYDKNQDEKTLMKAYDNDALHNHVLYLLHRIKWDTDSEGVNPKAYDCFVEWVPKDHRVSYYAVAKEKQEIIMGGDKIVVRKDQKLHIGNSYKYTTDLFDRMAKEAGFKTVDCIEEKNNHMAIHVLKS